MGLRVFTVKLGIVVAMLAFAGCRTDPSVDLLEAECRYWEDRYYEQQHQNEILSLQVRQKEAVSKKEDDTSPSTGPVDIDINAVPSIQLGSTDRRSSNPSSATAVSKAPAWTDSETLATADLPKWSPTPLPPATPPRSAPRNPSGVVSVLASHTTPARPEPAGNPTTTPTPPTSPSRELARLMTTTHPTTTQGAHPAQTPHIATGNPPVTHIVFNDALTGRVDLDGNGSDDGIRVVIEPRNAKDQYVTAVGSVSVVVLDPSKKGEFARVARWDFEAAEAAKLLRTTPTQRGLFLELPWPQTAPKNPTLRLFVRYQTADGKRFQIDRDIMRQQDSRVITTAANHPPQAKSQPSSPALLPAAAPNAKAIDPTPLWKRIRRQ